MVKISVIVPVFNGEMYLKECLDSLVNQTLSDIEIIAVNDGSTDNSLSILEDYARNDKRIKVITQKNKGIGDTRNNGINAAQGEYIGFVDCDDKIDLNYYEKMYNTAKKHNASVAISGIFRLRDGRSRYFLKYNSEKIYTKTIDKYIASNIPKSCYVWNKIYNRSEFVMSGLKFGGGVFYEDVEFIHRALYALKDMVTVPGTLYYYRQNPLSVLGQNDDLRKQQLRNAMDSALKFIENNNINMDLCRYPAKKKTLIKFLGIPFMRVKEWEYSAKYYLFYFIPIINIKYIK